MLTETDHYYWLNSLDAFAGIHHFFKSQPTKLCIFIDAYLIEPAFDSFIPYKALTLQL